MKNFIYFLLLSFIFSSCISKKKFDELTAERMTCADELAALKTEFSNIQENLNTITDQNEAYSIQLDNQGTTIGNLQDQVVDYNNISSQNEKYAATLAQSQSIITQKESEIGAMRDNFERVVKAVSPRAYSEYSTSSGFYTDVEVAENIATTAVRNRTTRVTNVIDTVVSTPKYRVTEGNLAVFCPAEMTYQKPHDVMAIIADFISEEAIKDELFTQIQRNEPDIERGDMDETTFIEKIEYYNLIKLELESAVKDAFEINKVHEFDEQKIQRGMEGWHWKVTPISDEPNQSLVVKATFVAPNGGRKEPFFKSYPINVTVESSRFFNTAKMLMINNPGWAIVTLFIPFLTFLLGYFIKNKKVKKNISGENN